MRRAGHSGIDVFENSLSHISAAEFKNVLRNITTELPGIASQPALDSLSPLLGGLTKWAEGLETYKPGESAGLGRPERAP